MAHIFVQPIVWKWRSVRFKKRALALRMPQALLARSLPGGVWIVYSKGFGDQFITGRVAGAHIGNA